MKKVVLILILLVTFSLTFANSKKEKKSNDYDIEYVYVKNSDGMNTCYARHCTTYTGSDGFEYKNCTDWEEVPCQNIILAK